MPYRTKIFKLLPWIGGVNTSLDPAIIPPNQLVKAENLTFGVRGSRQMRDGINFNWDSAANGSANIIAGMDYWYSYNPRLNLKMGCGDDLSLYQWTTSGTQTKPSLMSQSVTFSNASPTQVTATAHGCVQNERVVFSGGSLPPGISAGTTYYVIQIVTAGVVDANNFNISLTPYPNQSLVNTTGSGSGTMAPVAWSGTPTLASMTTLNGLCIFGNNQTGNYPRKYAGSGSMRSLGGNTPNAWVFGQFLGRLWSNDGTNQDRIQYTTTGNPEEWQGAGDSGSLDIGIGDGDPVGITAMFAFQGIFYVAKLTKLYRIINNTPETFMIQLVSSGLGVVGPNAWAAVDQDDIVFVSQKGIHSLVGTINSGDEQAHYLSLPIQNTFNSTWTKRLLPQIWGAYLPQYNSVAFAVNDSTYTGSYNNTVWFYNVALQSWYNWPNIPCQSMFVGTDTDKQRLYFGGNNSRMAKGLNGTNYDVGNTGTNTAITMNVKTGVIYLNDNPFMVNGFKRFSLIYGPQGTHTINVTFKIDNYTAQSFAYSQTQTGGVLGVSFILGQSTLGYNFVTGPYQQGIDGIGRGFQVTLSQSGQQAPIDIQGIAVEYEELGPAQETIQSG